MEPTTESYKAGLTPRESYLLSALAREGRNVFRPEDARRILGEDPKKHLHSLSRKKWVLRLKRGLYAIVPMDVGLRGSDSFIVHDFVIASHLASPYYVGFWSALNYHGLTEQIPRTVFIAATRPRKPVKVLTSTFLFVQLSRRKFFGIEKVEVDGAEVRISNREKTLVDCLDHPEHAGGIEEVARAIFFSHKGLNFRKVKEYALKAGSITIVKRLGFVLETCGLLEEYPDLFAGVRLTAGYPKLDKIGPAKGRISTRWKLRINVELDPERWMY